jgi:hypothetical protein
MEGLKSDRTPPIVVVVPRGYSQVRKALVSRGAKNKGMVEGAAIGAFESTQK